MDRFHPHRSHAGSACKHEQVVETRARGRLAAFTAGAWPGLPNLLASHHLQGLLRLDAGAAPGSHPQVRDSYVLGHHHLQFAQ